MDALARKLIKVMRNGDEYRFTYAQGGDIFTLKSTERPLPDLPKALEKLRLAAIDAVGFIDKKYHGSVHVQGVSCDWKGDDNRRNAVIHLFVDKQAEGVCEVSTPKRLADTAIKEAKKARWDADVVKVVDELSKQAFLYIDGERSQQSMPLMEGGKRKKGDKDGEKALDNELDAAA